MLPCATGGGPSGISRLFGRWLWLYWGSRPWRPQPCEIIAAANAIERVRRDLLSYPPRPVRYTDPDRRQSAHIRAVLCGEYARRHGASPARKQARDTRGDRAMESRAWL